jgi:type II secretory ATPase GspE/PulE/Tfp pilus assembly ATPase PilB-like protein
MSTANSVQFEELKLDSLSPEQAVATLLRQAMEMNASDLFFSAAEDCTEIQVRHLGTIRSLGQINPTFARRCLTHIKALAGIPLQNRRRPYEGRWVSIDDEGRKADLRLSTIPTLHGEDLSLRLLRRDSSLRNLDGLGMSRRQLNEVLAMVTAPAGLILVTGPTSAGKTTTLYACLQHLNDGRRRLNTIEDPIEYSVAGIQQSQINPAVNLDFPDLLRSVLRHSPDVIMIGEIRDPVTAQTAVRAANSGHLVLATLHAPTACGAVQSMINLDVHPHSLSSSLRGVIAQRLVRTLCPQCKVKYDLDESSDTFQELAPWLVEGEGRHFWTAPGCAACANAGFVDRTGVFEVLSITPALRQLISQARPAGEIEQSAQGEGLVNFRQAGLLKVAQGQTSIEEVIRVVPAEFLDVE